MGQEQRGNGWTRTLPGTKKAQPNMETESECVEGGLHSGNINHKASQGTQKESEQQSINAKANGHPGYNSFSDSH